MLAPFHKHKVYHPHIEAKVIVPFWFQDPAQNNSPGLTDFSGTCLKLLCLIHLGLDPLLPTGEAEKLPEACSWSLSQLEQLWPEQAVLQWSLLCNSPLREATLQHTFNQPQDFKLCRWWHVRIQKPLSWCRFLIGATWSKFSWEGILFTTILKTAVWTLIRFSLFSFKSPLFSKVVLLWTSR